MTIVVNGEAAQVPQGQTVLAFLESLGLEPGRLAVELNGAILAKPDWPVTVLEPGVRLEIVHFVGGG